MIETSMFVSGYVVLVECKQRNTKHLQMGSSSIWGPISKVKHDIRSLLDSGTFLKCEIKAFRLFLLYSLVNCNRTVPPQRKNYSTFINKAFVSVSTSALISTTIFFFNWDFFIVETKQLTKNLLTIEHGMR